jgi:hypothetical protein
MDETTTTNFEYLDLNTVDPNNSIPPAVYALRLISADRKDHEFGPNSKTPGKLGSKFVLKWTVLDGEYAGRKLNSTIFESSMAPVILRKIMDATGVGQKEGESFFSWIARLSDSGADLKVLVAKDDRGNEIKYLTAVPNV